MLCYAIIAHNSDSTAININILAQLLLNLANLFIQSNPESKLVKEMTKESDRIIAGISLLFYLAATISTNIDQKASPEAKFISNGFLFGAFCARLSKAFCTDSVRIV